MKSLEDFNYLLSLDRRYTKTESEIFRLVSDEHDRRYTILSMSTLYKNTPCNARGSLVNQ